MGLTRLAADEPTLIVKPADANRYRLILTHAGGAYVLDVIDSQASSTDSPPVSVSLTSAKLDNPGQATLVGSDKPLVISHENGRFTLVVSPTPVASVVLK